MRGSGRLIVVDADVGTGAADPARASAGHPVDPRALNLSQCLDAVIAARHTAVFSPALRKEWLGHAGRGALKWLGRMKDRGLLEWLSDEPDQTPFRAAIVQGLPEAERPAAEKDVHLVATAMIEADKRLLSCDGAARGKFCRVSLLHASMRGLHWVDPTWPDVRQWLLERAPDRDEWTLGQPEA